MDIWWTKRNQQKKLLSEYQKSSFTVGTQSRDRTGMEMNPLVFETSASTNSAIWALAAAKVMDFF